MSVAEVPADWVEIGPRGIDAADVLSWAELPVEGWVGDALAELDACECSDRVLLDAVTVWDRLGAWVAGQQARVIAEFSRRRPQTDPEAADPANYMFPGAEPSDPEVDDSAADELSLAMAVATKTAATRMDFARQLAFRHPDVLLGMCTGTVAVAKAHVIVDQAVELSDDQCQVLDHRVLPGIGARTRRQVYEKVRREVMRIDTDAVRRREQAAARKRAVQLVPLPDGVAELVCTLPAPDAVAGYNWLDQQARTAKAAGDERTLDQLRADAFVDLVTSRSTAVARKPLVQVLVPVSTLAGGARPADLVGYGPVHAGLARQLAADGTWQRLLTDPATGSVTGTDTRRYRPPAALRTFVEARDRTCRFPTCNQPARRCDVDHTRPYRHSKRTHPDNLAALCRRHHKLKDRPGTGWSIRRTADGALVWTTPTGHTFEVPPEPPAAPDAPTEPDPPTDVPAAVPDDPPPF